ncbi:ricin-type beta-trefoil lectin domain protein [Streptomyces wuyuanensis]|uniref:ricin-type beta-trefoil lectin domain protein n=1 Tax=Streptomyces wuyuanensis TaxID=1196353 RepID=UPI003D70286B
MPELHNAGPLHTHGQPDDSALSDAELGERIRSGAPRADPAIQELKRRHLPAVLAYARLCGRNQTAGNQLAVQALRLASEEAGRGIEPRGQWRHHLLMLVRRVGTEWARGDRRARLSADFAAWTDAAADAGPGTVRDAGSVPAGAAGQPTAGPAPEVSAAVLAAFYRLPALTRGVLWYAVVDQESDSTVAGYLGVRADLVPDLRLRAPESMRQAFLQAYLEQGDKRCLGYRRIIEAAARPVDRRRSGDLTLHLAECPRCTRVVAELTRMTDNPRMVFAEHLLGWGGAEYTARLPVSRMPAAVPARGPVPGNAPVTAPVTAPGSGPVVSAGEPAPETAAAPDRPGQPSAGAALWWGLRLPSRSLLLIAAAVVVAASAATGTVLVAASGHSGASREPVASAPTPDGDFPTFEAPPPVPTLSTSPGGTHSARPTPSPTRTPPPAASEPPAAAPTKSVVPIPAPIVPGAGYHPVVNAGTGLCLDVEDGVMANRTDVITTACNGATTQRWRLEPNGLLRNSADPEFCLDSRGDTDRGAGIWSCSSVDGRNGINLQFAVDGAGVVSPRIDPDFALEPRGGSLGFDRLDGDADQRWNAGTSR